MADDTEQSELERLRAENAALKAVAGGTQGTVVVTRIESSSHSQ